MAQTKAVAKAAKLDLAVLASDVNGGKFKVLKWDRDEKRYYDIEIDLRGRNE